MLHPQVLRTEALSARKTFAAEDRHSVDHRGMVDTSVEPYHLDYWSILTTLIVTGLDLSKSLSISLDQTGSKDHSVATIGLVSKICHSLDPRASCVLL